MANVRPLTASVLARGMENRLPGSTQAHPPSHDLEELSVPQTPHRFVAGIITVRHELLYLLQPSGGEHSIEARFDPSG